MASAACRRRTWQQPFAFDGSVVGYEPAESDVEDQGRQLELARPDLVSDDIFADRVAAQTGQGVRPDVRSGQRRPQTASRSPSCRWRRQIADRLIRMFTRDEHGRRPVYGGNDKFQDDPHWRDLLLFYEYFHGDNGAGLGAWHQTGWTALVASLIDEWRR